MMRRQQLQRAKARCRIGNRRVDDEFVDGVVLLQRIQLGMHLRGGAFQQRRRARLDNVVAKAALRTYRSACSRLATLTPWPPLTLT